MIQREYIICVCPYVHVFHSFNIVCPCVSVNADHRSRAPSIALSRAIKGPTPAPRLPPPLLHLVVPRDVRRLSPGATGDGDDGNLGCSPTVWRARRREIALRSLSFPAVRRYSGGLVGRADQEGMWPWLTGRRRLRSDLIWPVPLAVVAISFVGGGRHEAA